MAKTTLTRLIAALSLMTGCAYHVYSPPARMLPLESAATLQPGETGIQGEAGGVSWIDGATGAVRVRHGFTDRVEASAEASVLHVGHQSAAGTNPNAFTLRIGTKYRLAPWLSLAGGLGGGGSAAGAFVAPDVAAIVAWENPYLVPFFSLRSGLSLPIGAKQVDVTQVGDTITHVGTPELTWLVGATAGLRVPLGSRDPHPGDVHGNILLGLGMTVLKDGHDDQGAVQGGLGVEVVF